MPKLFNIISLLTLTKYWASVVHTQVSKLLKGISWDKAIAVHRLSTRLYHLKEAIGTLYFYRKSRLALVQPMPPLGFHSSYGPEPRFEISLFGSSYCP